MYNFNPKKSAVLVFGESQALRKQSAKFRTYRVGYHKIEEKTMYDHVGLKTSVLENNDKRINDKIGKGRRAQFSILPLILY